MSRDGQDDEGADSDDLLRGCDLGENKLQPKDTNAIDHSLWPGQRLSAEIGCGCGAFYE